MKRRKGLGVAPFCVVEEVVPPEVERTYRELTTDDLKYLRVAFVLDKKDGADAAFCDARLAVIDKVLAARKPS